MSDNHLNEAISKIRQRQGVEETPAPLTLPEAARLMLRVLDARPARLNSGLTLETQLLRAALVEWETFERPRPSPIPLEPLEPLVPVASKHRPGCACRPDEHDVCPGCGRRVA